MLLRLISDLLDSAGWSMDDADELRTADNRLQRECLMLQDVERRTLLGAKHELQKTRARDRVNNERKGIFHR